MKLSKEDIFELIIKGFGIYFAYLVISCINDIIYQLTTFISYTASSHFEVFKSDYGLATIRGCQIRAVIAMISTIIRMTIYLLISVNLLRSGSFIHKLIGKKANNNETATSKDEIPVCNLNKDDLFKYVVKGFGILLLVYVVQYIPGICKGIMIISYIIFHPKIDFDVSRWALVVDGFGQLVAVIIFLFAARNFLTTQSWIKWLQKKRK